MNLRPLFIAGCDCSGSTLLGELLGRSRWSITTPESQFIHDFLIQLGLKAFDDRMAAARWLQSHFRFAAWGLDVDTEHLAGLIDLERPRATIENIVALYARSTQPSKPVADVWIDHTPDNFRFHPMLKRIFPDARFVHVVRDGRAVCASIRPLDWGPNNAYSASRHWSGRLQQAMAVELAEGANCLRVRVEDLLQDPGRVLRELCTFVDLPFDPRLLDDQAASRGCMAARQRPDGAANGIRADDWRTRMSQADIRHFESYPLTHTLLRRLGYDTVHASPPQVSTLRTLALYLHDFAYYLVHRAHRRRMEARSVARYRTRGPATDAG